MYEVAGSGKVYSRTNSGRFWTGAFTFAQSGLSGLLNTFPANSGAVYVSGSDYSGHGYLVRCL